MSLPKLILLACAAYAVYQHHAELKSFYSRVITPTVQPATTPAASRQFFRPQPAAFKPPGPQKLKVEVFTIPNCPPCVVLERNLQRANIRYTKYDITQNKLYERKLHRLLNAAGYRGGTIGMPMSFAGNHVFRGPVTAEEMAPYIY
jgi:glutaredoxin